MHILVFTGGNSPLPHNTVFYSSRAPELDYVIAADSGLDTLEAFRHFYGNSYDLSPDFIIGDMDSLRDMSLLQKYADVPSEIYNRDKNFTDTELALQKAVSLLPKEGNNRITLIGGGGGEYADHFLGIIDTFATPYHADFWLCGQQAICYLGKDMRLEVSNVRPEQRISVARVPSFYTGGVIETEGLEWESRVFRKEGMPSISNRIATAHSSHASAQQNASAQQKVTFTVREQAFLVIVPITAILKKEMI